MTKPRELSMRLIPQKINPSLLRRHSHRSFGAGHWNVLRAMGGFEQVHQHVRAGSLSRDRESAEQKYGTRHVMRIDSATHLPSNYSSLAYR